MPVVVNEIVQTDAEVEIQARIDAERARLRHKLDWRACASSRSRSSAPSLVLNGIT